MNYGIEILYRSYFLGGKTKKELKAWNRIAIVFLEL